MASPKERFYPETAFGGFTDIDGTVAFYNRIAALIEPGFTVIDFGCGRGVRAEDVVRHRRNLANLRGRVSTVIGLDIDRAGEQNPLIDEFRPLTIGKEWPVADGAADLVICDSVIEHLPEPTVFFSESKRVLRSGGYLCVRTPNVFSYVGIASRLVPNRYHANVLSRAQNERKEEDVFPTLYRCNTVAALRTQLYAHGFKGVVYGHEAEPSYLDFSSIAYAAGILHRRLAPGFMRPVLFAFARA